MDSISAKENLRVDRSSTFHSMHRSASNISSTSSDILVATISDPAATRNDMQSRPSMDRRKNDADASTANASLRRRAVLARSENRLILIVPITPQRLIELSSAAGTRANVVDVRTPSPSVTGVDTSGRRNGPNSRGTYSKEYTLRHPEIQWTHRGQGRYLPASQLKKEAIASLQRPTRPARLDLISGIIDSEPSPGLESSSNPQHQPLQLQQEIKPTLNRADTQTSTTSSAATPEIQRRKRRAVHETLQDSLSPVPVYGLRHRPSLQPTPLTPAQHPVSQRPTRRVKSLPGTFSVDNLALRRIHGSERDEDADDATEKGDEFSQSVVDDDEDHTSDSQSQEQSDENSDDAMTGSDDTQTFTKDYVNAHPDDDFYHVGNGWYKRGLRGKRNRHTNKLRDIGDNVERLSDGTYTFDPTKTVHGSQIDKFPGYEFHHTGNGWYKAGPMPSAKRSSIQIPLQSSAGSAAASNADDSDSIDRLTKTVSKEHTLLHPEVEWIHRGNGRYISKESLTQASTPAPASAASPAERRLSRDDSTVDKAYVEAHPNEHWHHTGNGRYRRGPRISLKIGGHGTQSAARGQTTDAQDGNDDSDEEDDDSNILYDKAYVDAHPHLEFHHRGQGRYKRGPRLPRPDVPTPVSSLFHDDGDGPDILVDTAYVEAHPNETFHHKGQGRWARGMPPPGSSNKTAVRGPGAKTRAEAEKGLEPADEVSTNAEGEKPPALTALVLRSDGPDKWPNIQWHYRGGGKWSRMTKLQWEQKSSPAQDYNVATFSRYKPHRMAHNTGADPADTDGFDDEASVVADHDEHDRPVPKRRRRFQRVSAVPVRDDGHQSSQSHSDAPTPRPPMLAPGDDILGPEDLPDLFRDSFSPLDPEDDDAASRVYRAQYRPLNVDALLRSLTKYDPAVRPTENLLLIAKNTQEAMQVLQDEYLELERITAPHSRIPRKPAKGGRPPAPSQVFEDRKESELYDYNYDPRKVGYQDPIAQRVVRDAEGRELRKRRARNALDPNVTLPGWDFGEGADLAPKRQSRQPTRFDGTAAPQMTRRRGGHPMERTNTATSLTSVNQRARLSVSPDRTGTPIPQSSTHLGLPLSQTPYQPATTGRWAGHVPKRIRELQRESSVGSVRSDASNNSAGPLESTVALQPNGSTSPTMMEKRKGRPPGSKNHHKRRDAGIKKGPRKPKMANADGEEDGTPPIGDNLGTNDDMAMNDVDGWGYGYRSHTPEILMGDA